MKLIDEITGRAQKAKDYLATKRDLWDENEQLFTNQLGDEISDTTKSQVFDPKLATMAIERSNRVMAQLPIGKVKSISKNDEGTSRLMNLTVDKYIVPNANAQFDFLTKCRLVNLYSNIYGSFYVFVDWDVKPNGYVGPDMWLLNIRDVLPQVGAISLADSDYIIVRTWKPYSFFENLKGKKGYKNIDKILENLKDKTGSKDQREEKSQREENQYPNEQAAKGKGYFEVLSQYERDRWVDYVVDSKNGIFRDTDNPHKNGELPVIEKYSQPLIDDFIGMGDFERGATMQKGVNSLWNLYLDGVKLSISPPTMVNKDNIADSSSFKFTPGAKWLGRNNIQNLAQTLNLSPQGINTFNNTYQVMNAALLNMFGTTDTAVTAQTDPGMGKTPQALKMQGNRENTRDNADRFYQEQFIKKVMNRFINLVTKKQSGALQVRLFEAEIEELKKSYPEIEDMYDEKSGKITIPKSKFGSVVFDYEMVSGSTYVIDQEQQQSNLLSVLDLFIKNPQMIQYLGEKENKEVKIGELITRIMANSGIQDWGKIVVDLNEGDGDVEGILNQGQNQFQQALQAMQQMETTPTQPGNMSPQQGGPNEAQTGYPA